MQTLLDWLHAAFIWLGKIILCVPRYIYQYFMETSTTLIDWIYAQMTASFALKLSLTELQGLINNLEPIHYYLAFFRMDYGFKVVISAWILRFIIRRVPFIG